MNYMYKSMCLLAVVLTGTIGVNASIVTLVPANRGFAVCADKRSFDEVAGHADNENKIYQLVACL